MKPLFCGMNVPAYFEELPDFRVKGRCLHALSDIVMLTLCGLIADREDFEEIEDYGNDKKVYLQRFLQLPNGIPSHDTLNRVFRHLDVAALESCLRKWGQAILAHLDYDHLRIDGKELRGTTPAGGKHALNQLVSVWGSEAQRILAQRQIGTKQNEIVAIPEVLQLVAIEQKVVTIDAIGCQHTIVKQIIEQKGDYLLALKANPGELYEQVQAHFEKYGHEVVVWTQYDKDHHRAEQRQYYFSNKGNAMACLGDWQECKSVCLVECKRTYLGQTTTHKRYSISRRGTVVWPKYPLTN